MTGRGAWNKSGVGGTLNAKGDGPGMYYRLAQEGTVMVGQRGWTSGDVNERAVHGGVVALQRALNRRLPGDPVIDNGRFDKATDRATRQFQEKAGLVVDGIIGPVTARRLLLPDLQGLCKKRVFPYDTVVCGIVQAESMWDPGAVGRVDDNDLGLAQINGPAHPTLTDKQRLQPITAFNFVIDYLVRALNDSGLVTVEDCIASYNLGIGGARAWVLSGRPDYWRPGGAGTTARHMGGPNCKDHDLQGEGYIDRIKNACL